MRDPGPQAFGFLTRARAVIIVISPINKPYFNPWFSHCKSRKVFSPTFTPRRLRRLVPAILVGHIDLQRALSSRWWKMSHHQDPSKIGIEHGLTMKHRGLFRFEWNQLIVFGLSHWLIMVEDCLRKNRSNWIISFFLTDNIGLVDPSELHQ